MARVLRQSGSGATEFRVPNPLHAALPSLSAAAVAGAAALATSRSPFVVLAVSLVILGAFRAAVAARDVWRLRHTADELLRTGAAVHPESALLTWRATELTSNRNRKILARSLQRVADDVEHPAVVAAVPLNRSALQPHLALVRGLVARLTAVERPVAAQGMALVEELLTDGLSSPLYGSRPEADLRTALGRCLRALEQRGHGDGSPLGLPRRARLDSRSHGNRIHLGGNR